MNRSFKNYLLITLRGLGMGAADVIPGVSGGTIAFITGIYEELINSIKSFNAAFVQKLFKEGIAAAWKHVNGTFLVALLTGVLISIFSLARLFSWLLENYELMVWAFFFGLIVGSAIHVGRQITRWNPFSILMLLAGTAIAWYITVAAPATTPESYWFIFLSGGIAICAMILPGISGSFILLLLGKYEFMLNVIRDMQISLLAVFAAGCAAGLITFSNVIAWLFRHFRNATLALLTGFMIGSLNKLWPWKEVIETRINSDGQVVPFLERSILPHTFESLYNLPSQLGPVVLLALAGLAVILVFEFKAPTPKEAEVIKEKA